MGHKALHGRAQTVREGLQQSGHARRGGEGADLCVERSERGWGQSRGGVARRSQADPPRQGLGCAPQGLVQCIRGLRRVQVTKTPSRAAMPPLQRRRGGASLAQSPLGLCCLGRVRQGTTGPSRQSPARPKRRRVQAGHSAHCASSFLQGPSYAGSRRMGRHKQPHRAHLVAVGAMGEEARSSRLERVALVLRGSAHRAHLQHLHEEPQGGGATGQAPGDVCRDQG